MDEITLKRDYRPANNSDIPTIGRLLAKNPDSVYIQSIDEKSRPVLLTTILRGSVLVTFHLGYNTLCGIDEKTGARRSLRIVEETTEAEVDGKTRYEKRNIVQSHCTNEDGWHPVPLEITKIFIPKFTQK